MFPHHSVGEGLAPPDVSQKWPWFAVGASPRLARPRFMGTAPSDAHSDPHPLPRLVGTRRGGEMVQANILRRPGPSGPEGINTWNRILCAGNFVEGRRGIPRKRGSGGGATMGGDAHRSPSPAAFWFLFRREKRNSPKGRNPPRGTKPFRTLAGGSGDPPLQRFRRITAGRENGRGRPLPYGTVGKHSAPEDAQKTQHPAGLFRKRAWRGLTTIKCIIMYHF